MFSDTLMMVISIFAQVGWVVVPWMVNVSVAPAATLSTL